MNMPRRRKAIQPCSTKNENTVPSDSGRVATLGMLLYVEWRGYLRHFVRYVGTTRLLKQTTYSVFVHRRPCLLPAVTKKRMRE